MRLPEYLRGISPIGEILDAVETAEADLEADIAAENARLAVGSADRDGLGLWEADYGLADSTGLPLDVRRAKIRTAMSSAATLTPAYLRELCLTIGGADDGEVEEDFPRWTVQVRPVTAGRVITDLTILEESIRKLLPAHLVLEMVPCARLTASDPAYAVLSGGVMAEPAGELAVETAQGLAVMVRAGVATGAAAPELWGRV